MIRALPGLGKAYMQRVRRHSAYRKISIGAASNLFGQSAQIFVQLGIIPLLMYYWGVPQYGKWLLYSTIPSYLAFCDLGFSSAAQLRLGAMIGTGDRVTAASTWRAANLVTVAIVIALLAAASAVLVLAQILREHYIDNELSALMIVYGAVILLRSSFLAALRGSGSYSTATFLDGWATLGDAILTVASAAVSSDLKIAAALIIANRLCFTYYLYRVAKQRTPWLLRNAASDPRKEIRALFAPSLSLAIMPLALAFSLQGTISATGIIWGGAAAVALSATRTVCRVPLQLCSVITRASVPELARAYGARDESIIRSVYRLHKLLFCWGLLPTTLVAILIGPYFIHLWTYGRLHVDPVFFGAITTAMLFHAVWWSLAALLAVEGLQKVFAPVYLLVSAGSILTLMVLPATAPPETVALVILLQEAVMLLFLAFVGRRQLQSIRHSGSIWPVQFLASE